MNETTPLSKRDYKPGFIRRLLEKAPLLPTESREELLALYHEFECSDDSAPATAAEHMMLFEVVMLITNIQSNAIAATSSCTTGLRRLPL